MSDLFATVMAMNASSEASAAHSEARKAKDAAESRLDGKAHFVVIPLAGFQKIKEKGWFKPTKYKLTGEYKRISIKNTDVARLMQTKDDFGNVYTRIVLEERGQIEDDEGYITTGYDVALSLKDTTDLLNKEVILKDKR